MADEKSIGDKSSQHKNNNQTRSLTLNEQKAIRDVLRNKHQISVVKTEDTADSLLSRGFRKVADNEVSQLTAVFQFTPQLAMSKAYRAAVDTAFSAATEGTFIVRLDAGMHLCKSSLTPEAYRGVGLSNTTNQIAGNAELLPNDAILTVSNAPQIALSVFNVASLITGQYFMTQINAKLSDLSRSIEHIEQYFDVARRAELRAAFEELEDIFNQHQLIKMNTVRLTSTATALSQIQHIALKSINLCQDQIGSELKISDRKDKDSEIKKRIDRIGQYLIEYQYAVQLYSVSEIIAVQLLNDIDPGSLSTRHGKIISKARQYKELLEKCKNGLKVYIDNSKALNNRNPIQNIVSVGSGALVQAVSGDRGAQAAINTTKVVDSLFKDHQEKIKNTLVEATNYYLNQASHTDDIDKPAQSLHGYIDIVSNSIEFAFLDGEYYTSLPPVDE